MQSRHHGLKVCVAAAALAAGFAVPAAQCQTVKPIPHPIIVDQPDLVLDGINVVGTQCNGGHTAYVSVVVKLRNGGFGTAVLPTWKSWLMIWSVFGYPTGPTVQYFGAPPANLTSGQILTLKGKVLVYGHQSADKKTWAVGIGALADPQKAITEVNEDNNEKYDQENFGAPFCP